MKRNKDKEKKEYEKISATESLSSLSNVFTKAEIDALTSSTTTDDFVLDELAKYAIANDTSTTSSNGISVKTINSANNLSSLSLNSRRNCI